MFFTTLFFESAETLTVYMEIQEPWFSEIAAGRKTVEGRTGSPDKFSGLVGGNLYIYPPKRGPVFPQGAFGIYVKIVAVRHYSDLAEYIRGEGWEKIAPHTGSNSAALDAYLQITAGDEFVFSQERVALRGGMVAIEIKLL